MKKCILFLFFVCFYIQSYSQIVVTEGNETVTIYKSSDFTEVVKKLTKIYKKEPHIYDPNGNGNSMSLLDVPSITTDIFSESYKFSLKATWEMQDDVYTKYHLEKIVRQNGDIKMEFGAEYTFFNTDEETANYIFTTSLLRDCYEELGKENNLRKTRTAVYYEWDTPGLCRSLELKSMHPNKKTWRMKWADTAKK